MGAGVRDAFPPPMCCVVVFIHLRMETPLRGRSGGHTSTAPTVSFEQIARGCPPPMCVGPFVHLFTHENARVALQERIRQ